MEYIDEENTTQQQQVDKIPVKKIKQTQKSNNRLKRHR